MKTNALCLVTAVIVGAAAQLCFGQSLNPDWPNPGGAAASTTYDYDARATMVETITDLGGGQWKYHYAFTNDDTVSIWYVKVWFDDVSASVSGLTTWAGHATWDTIAHSDPAEYRLPGPLGQPFAVYTWGPSWPSGPDQIPVGATWSSFSVVLDHYEPGFKQFGYMVNGHHWSGDHCDAVGWTVPEPATLSLLALGTLALIGRRRR